MEVAVPQVNIASRWSRGGLGAFVGETAFAHYLDAYRAGMALLPPHETFDVPTAFGTVRSYRFAGPECGRRWSCCRAATRRRRCTPPT